MVGKLAGLATCLLVASFASAETWRGLTVAPERRCARYDADDYRYPQSVEADIVASIGKIYSPYTGRCFATTRQTDIEHIVARSEAHDSGLCAASAATRRAFASDLLNLTLASPRVNRSAKRDHDAVGWMPDENRCWFADRVVRVRRKYGLTIDRREADALERVLSACESTGMIVYACAPGQTSPERRAAAAAPSADGAEALRRWDDNGNGRITCAEARRHGIAPVPRSHPAYRYMSDGDGDGVVCE